MINRRELWQQRRLALVIVLATFLLTCNLDQRTALAQASPLQLIGMDISWPQCQTGIPSLSAGQTFTIIGATGGRAFTPNTCFASEYRWATAHRQTPSFYMNLNYPSPTTAARGQAGPSGNCKPADAACQAFNYGYNAGQDALAYAQSVGASSPGWWLDVETANSWSSNTSLNAQVIRGAIRFFQDHNLAVGIYSVAFMWRDIAGSFSPGLPIWVAQTNTNIPTLAYCSPRYGFGVGLTLLVQSWNGRYDVNYGCSGQSVTNAAALLGGASSGSDGSVTSPIPFASAVNGSLAASEGGTAIYYTFLGSGNGSTQSATFSFWPHGPEVANGIFVSLYQNGSPLAKVQASDSTTPGYLTLHYSARGSGPVVLQIVNYNNPSAATRISYDLSRA